MSLHPEVSYLMPEETERVARAAFPRGNMYMRMRDTFGQMYDHQPFVPLFSARGRPAEAPARLALVTVMQFAEGLSDRQAADAVRSRIDWKYALSLELTDPGFDSSVLSEFRTRLLANGAETLLLETLLTRFGEQGLLKVRGKQRTDSSHVLAAVRALNRVELVGETVWHALNVLATVAPEWLRVHTPPEWVERYAYRCDEYRLPKGKAAQQARAETIGTDGVTLLTTIYGDTAVGWLRTVPAIETLRRVWMQNYLSTEGRTRWRTNDNIPPSAQFISSPYDTDAHLGKKGSICWVGYKVHLTETCEEDAPHLITHVETTAAPTADGAVTPRIHRALHAQDRLPAIHLVDTGFLDAELLVTSRRDYGVELLGPTRKDQRWQARAAEGFGIDNFTIDWEARKATCPEGHASVEWVPRIDNRGNDSIYIRFSRADCGPCPSRARCTRSTYARRAIAVRPQAQYDVLQQRRQFEGSRTYTKIYAKRAGIEGTISQGVRRCRMRRSRYVGATKTHLQHVVTAAALNFVRVSAWLAGTPRARTRRAPFAALMSP
jgi:transposase